MKPLCVVQSLDVGLSDFRRALGTGDFEFEEL